MISTGIGVSIDKPLGFNDHCLIDMSVARFHVRVTRFTSLDHNMSEFDDVLERLVALQEQAPRSEKRSP